MGSDQYQLRSAEAIRRFWALGLCLYQYLDSLRHRLEQDRHRHVTLGEALGWLRQRHEDLALHCTCRQAGCESNSEPSHPGFLRPGAQAFGDCQLLKPQNY